MIMEYLQNLDNVHAHKGRGGATIAGQQSDWDWNGVKIIRCGVCGAQERLLQASKVENGWSWPYSKIRTKCRVFLQLCT